MLIIHNLHAGIDGKEILKGFNLEVKAGEVHAVMGPNGSGKSTLARVLAGDPHYEVTKGEILFTPPPVCNDSLRESVREADQTGGGVNGKNILGMEPEDRALLGIFLAFQYPVEIPGVNNASFLRMAYNAKRKFQGREEADPLEFDELLREKLKIVGMKPDFITRSVNHGFSGGEKKRNEIMQMAVLDPVLAVLDETDSGLDIDALKTVAEGVNRLRRKDNAIILITHYQRILNYVAPDRVHILAGGRIVRSGEGALALELEKKGYEAVSH